MIISIYALHYVKILHHLFHNLCVVGSHCVCRVIGQLYEQQRVDVHAFLLVCIRYLLAFLQGLVDEMLVEGNVVGISACHVGIEQHSLLYHLFAYNLLTVDIHQILRLCLRCCGYSNLHFGVNLLQHRLRLVGSFCPEEMFLVDHDYDGDVLLASFPCDVI